MEKGCFEVQRFGKRVVVDGEKLLNEVEFLQRHLKKVEKSGGYHPDFRAGMRIARLMLAGAVRAAKKR